MPKPLFQRMFQLSNADNRYLDLASEIRALHRLPDQTLVKGQVSVKHGNHLLVKYLVKLFGFPSVCLEKPAEVHFTVGENYVTYSRSYNGNEMHTTFYASKEKGRLLEKIGPFWILLKPIYKGENLELKITKFWLWRYLRLPLMVAPKVIASERGSDGYYYFDVDIHFPLIGRVIKYTGHLNVSKSIVI